MIRGCKQFGLVYRDFGIFVVIIEKNGLILISFNHRFCALIGVIFLGVAVFLLVTAWFLILGCRIFVGNCC